MHDRGDGGGGGGRENGLQEVGQRIFFEGQVRDTAIVEIFSFA